MSTRIVPGPRILLVIAAIALLAAAWRFTPLGDFIAVERLVALARSLREVPAAPLVVIGAFVVAGLLVVPLTLLVIATTIAFGPFAGAAYALAGAMTSAYVGHAIGRGIGRDALGRHAGRALAALDERVAGGGVLSVAALRLLPVAPFTLVNLFAGAAGLRVRTFLAGSLLGFVPGISVIAFATDRASAALARPDAVTIGTLVIVLAALFGAGAVLRRRLGRDTPQAARR